jgi:hypothetical protein
MTQLNKCKILVNSVPKSGTNLLVQIVKGIPGISQDQKIFYHGGNYHEILSIKDGEMVSSHIPFDREFSKKLSSHAIRHVFIYRDLRDIAVSMVHFINEKLHDHPLFPVFQNRIVSFEEQLNALILGIELQGEEKKNQYGIHYYPGIFKEYENIYKWLGDSSICKVRYEFLMRSEESRENEILKIIHFLWEDIQPLNLSKKQLLQLMKNNIDPSKAWTFRKGTIGGWREEFTEENKRNFKRTTGDLLIRLGYETSNNW